MKRLILIALIFMNTSNELVIHDPYGDLSDYSSTDILLFTYDDDSVEDSIEVTEGEGYSQEERDQLRQEITLTREFKKALDYWNTFNR